MTTFNFKNESLKSTTGKISASSNNCTYYKEYKGQNDVYRISNGYIAFPENKLHYTDTGFYLRIIFYPEYIMDNQVLLRGTSLPLQVNLMLTSPKGYLVSVQMPVNDYPRQMNAEFPITADEWHVLEFALLDGEFCFWADGKILGRRVFVGTPTCPKIPDGSVLYCGFGKEQMSGFKGYISEISFDDTVPQERIADAEALADIGYGEIESKRMDLSIDGINVGTRIASGKKLDEKSNCVYDEFQNGIIFWSEPYRSVWMSTPIAKRYFELLKSSYVGLPLDDERKIEGYGKFCLFDNIGLFLKNNGELIEVQGAFLDKYFHEGFIDSGYGYPEENVREIRIDDSKLFVQTFTKYILIQGISSDKTETITALRKDLAKAYLDNPLRYGQIQQVIFGYSGVEKRDVFVPSGHGVSVAQEKDQTVIHVESCYLLCSDDILCQYYSYTEDYWGTIIAETSNIFTITKEFFEYFVQNDGLNKNADYGVYQCPMDSLKTTSKGTKYQDFMGGVFVKYADGTFRAFSEIKITLNSISSGHIYDPPNKNAELFITVDLKRNNTYLEEEKRWPDYSKRKHGGQEFNIIYEGKAVSAEHKEGTNVHYEVPKIRGADTITLHVEAFDYDKVTKNDYLGSYTIPMDIESGWGTIKDCIPNNQKTGMSFGNDILRRTYEGVWLMDEGGDNRNGKGNIKLTFRVEGEMKDVNVNDYFRKYAYWTPDNYHYDKSHSLPRSLFDTTFGVSTGSWYDWILHFWDSVWYHVANNEYGGYGGQCFGLSVEALYAVNGMSPYNIPLYDWNLYSDAKRASMKANGELYAYATTDADINPGFAERIRAKHLYQCGWKHIRMVVDKLCMGETVPLRGFRGVQRLIDQDGCCLVNLFGKGGHTVLAYKYDTVSNEERIYVADSNHPWWTTDRLNNGSNKDSSYVTHTGSDLKARLHWYDSSKTSKEDTRDYSIIYGTPYSIVAKNPCVPSWWDLVGFVVDTVIKIPAFIANNLLALVFMLSSGDCEMTGVTVDGKSETVTNVPICELVDGTRQENYSLGVMGCLAEKTVSLTVLGVRTGVARVNIAIRNRIFSIEEKIAIGETKKITLTGLDTGHPLATVESYNGKSVVKGTAYCKKYGKSAVSCQHSGTSKKRAGVRYFVNQNAQKSGEHEIHTEYCKCKTNPGSLRFLGTFDSPQEALQEAKTLYANSNGCSKCCREIDTDRRK